MPIYQIQCSSCEHRYDAVTTTAEGAQDARRCPKCASIRLKRELGSFRVLMVDSKNMEPGEIAMALKHKADIEQNHERLEWKSGGPREFQPEIARTVY